MRELILDFNLDWMDIAVKIFLPLTITFIVAGIIGLERQNVGKAAGVSSHILVAMGSAGIAIMQRLMFEYHLSLGLDVDGQRIIAQVVTGIGFVGAGVIIKDQSSDTIKGITTAATIWSTAMVGLILGSGYILVGTIIGLFLVIFVLARDFTRGFNPFKPPAHGEREAEDHH
ncbi:MAG: MgtC/SapB family protein [Acholeplasmataceae bacterium]